MVGTHLDKLGESRIRPLLLLKLILAVQLMCSILDERRKVRHDFEEDITDLVDDVSLLLALVEHLGESDVDGMDLEDIPEDLGDEVFSTILGDDVGRSEGLDPALTR